MPDNAACRWPRAVFAPDVHPPSHPARPRPARAAARRSPGRCVRSHRRAGARQDRADLRPAAPELRRAERGRRPRGAPPDRSRRARRRQGGPVAAARHRAAGVPAGHRQDRRRLAALRRRGAHRAHLGVPGRCAGQGTIDFRAACARCTSASGHFGSDHDGANAAGAAAGRHAAAPPPGRAPRAHGLRHLHQRLHRQAQGHRRHAGQHLPLSAQRKRAPGGARGRPGLSGLLGRLRHELRGDLDQLSGGRHAVDRAQGDRRRPRGAAARADRKRHHRAARRAHAAGAVRAGRARPAPHQPGRRDVPAGAGGPVGHARSADVQHLWPHRGHGVGQPGRTARGRAGDDRRGPAQLWVDGDRGDRPGQHCRCSHAAAPAAALWRDRRAVHHRPGRSRWLPGPSRADGRKVFTQPLGAQCQ